jgi:regulator of sigma E protease
MHGIMSPEPLAPDLLARLAAWASTYPGGDTVFTIVLFIFVLSVLVFVHELGHYTAARQVGVKVLAFSIGFGRPLFKWSDKHHTEWRIGWLPLGGYVQLFGQEDLTPTVQSKKVGHYMSRSVLARAWIILAGPLANLVFGFVVLWGAFSLGEQRIKAEVGTVLPNMPAFGVLQTGDVLLQLNGQPIADWEDLLNQLQTHDGAPLQLAVQRAGAIQWLNLTPQLQTHTDVFGQTQQVARVGVAPSGATLVVERNIWQAALRAAERSYELTALTLKSLWKLLTGAIGTENLTGPLGIADLTGQTAHVGFYALFMLAALISVNLCVVNLFPLPVLDGGHLVMLGYEAVRGKPLGVAAQQWAFKVGFLCIISLVVVSTYHDLRGFGVV